MPTITVSDYIIASLKKSAVKRIYGLPGDSLNGLTDAMRRDGTLAWQHVRHEETAAFAAAGEAAMTGSLAVCAASCGPGNLHLINGLYDAARSRVPVLALAAHIPTAEIGSNYFQETHPQELFREASVFSELAASAEQFPHILHAAMRTAVEKQGVAVLVVPGDVLMSEIDEQPAIGITATRSVTIPGLEDLLRAAQVLNRAARVTVLAGAGTEGAHDEVVAIAEALKAPVVHALRGKEWIEYDNPNDVGMTGLLGFSSGYQAMEECDALLMLGTDFPYRQFYPSHAEVVQVDVRGEQIGRRTPVDVPLVGTVKDTVTALLPHLKRKPDDTHLDRMRDNYDNARRGLDDLAVNRRNRSPLHPQHVARLIDEIADDDAVFIPDVGTPVVWAARYLHMNGRRRLIGSFNHGTMANAVPQAVGVQASQPGRQVIAMSGDGGLAMMLGDLITLTQQDLPVKIVVFNNGSLAFVELEMKAGGLVNYGTDLTNPNFAAVAEALGIFGQRVEQADDLDSALRKAFAHDGPALVEVVTARQELSMPPKLKLEQVKGFTLYATRTVLSGRGDELIDLARTNLHRR